MVPWTVELSVTCVKVSPATAAYVWSAAWTATCWAALKALKVEGSFVEL
jgi:hypothetical protein